MTEIDDRNIIDWTQRSKRSRKATVTYWEEYVEQDPWYRQELLSDIPASELHAACYDSDFTHSGEEDSDSSESFISQNLSSDCDATYSDRDSESSEESEDCSGGCTDSEEETCLLRPTKGK